MPTIELAQEEIRQYLEAADFDAGVARHDPVISNKAMEVCCDFLKRRKLLGIPVKVTVTFTGGFGPNLYELWWG
jgi:hypothetical protein